MALEFAHIWWVETAVGPARRGKSFLEFAPLAFGAKAHVSSRFSRSKVIFDLFCLFFLKVL